MQTKFIKLFFAALLFVNVAFSQTLSVSELPKSVFGEYIDFRGNWVCDFHPGFLTLPGLAPGKITSLQKEGKVYTADINTFSASKEDYQMKFKFGEDTLWISRMQDTLFLPLMKDRKAFKYPNTQKMVKKLQGDWYTTDGENRKVATVKGNTISWGDYKYEFDYLLEHKNTRQLNLKGETEGRFVHLYSVSENYIDISILEAGGHKLKRSIDLPDLKSDDFKNVPKDLVGQWYSCTGDDDIKLEPYKITIGDQTHAMKQLSVEFDRVEVLLKDPDSGKDLTYTFYPIDDEYCRVDYGMKSGVILKKEKGLPNGMPVYLQLSDEWFDAETGQKEDGLKLNPTKEFLFDGYNYKQLVGEKEVAFRIINDQYIDLLEGGSYRLLKSSADLPAIAQVDELSDVFVKNWFSPVSGEWKLGFAGDKIIYDKSFWDKEALVYTADNSYRLSLVKSEQVCEYGDDGVALCRLEEKKATIGLKVDENGRVLFNFNGDSFEELSPKYDPVLYNKTEELPEWSSGMAVVRVQFFGDLNKVRGMPVKASSNVAHFIGQESVEGKMDEFGRVELEVPMSAPCPVYFSCWGYGTIMLFPNDTIMIGIDGDQPNMQKEWLWMGTGHQINMDMVRYSEQHGKFVRNKRNSTRSFLKLEPNEFKEKMKDISDRKLNLINWGLFKDYQCSPGFLTYFENSVKVEHWEELMRYTWLRGHYEKKEPLDSTSAYFDFIKDIDLSNKDYWSSESFSGLLNEINNYARNMDRKDGPVITFHVKESNYEIALEIIDDLSRKEKKCFEEVVEIQKRKVEGKEIGQHHRDVLSVNFLAIQGLVKKSSNKKEPLSYDQAFLLVLDSLQNELQPELVVGLKEYLGHTDNASEMYKQVYERNKDTLDAYFKVEVEKGKQREQEKYLVNIPGSDENKMVFRKGVKLEQYLRTVKSMDLEAIKIQLADIKKQDIEPWIKNYCEKKYQKVVDELAKPMPSDCHLAEITDISKGDELIVMLQEKYKGKVVYLDIWAPWCSPCRGEMERAHKLKNMMKGEEVVWVYLCGSGDKKAWENCIKKYHASGYHYFLTGDAQKAYKEFGKKYNVTGIPRFMIMNKKGEFVVEQALRPSNAANTSKQLKEYL